MAKADHGEVVMMNRDELLTLMISANEVGDHKTVEKLMYTAFLCLRKRPTNEISDFLDEFMGQPMFRPGFARFGSYMNPHYRNLLIEACHRRDLPNSWYWLYLNVLENYTEYPTSVFDRGKELIDDFLQFLHDSLYNGFGISEDKACSLLSSLGENGVKIIKEYMLYKANDSYTSHILRSNSNLFDANYVFEFLVAYAEKKDKSIETFYNDCLIEFLTEYPGAVSLEQSLLIMETGALKDIILALFPDPPISSGQFDCLDADTVVKQSRVLMALLIFFPEALHKHIISEWQTAFRRYIAEFVKINHQEVRLEDKVLTIDGVYSTIDPTKLYIVERRWLSSLVEVTADSQVKYDSRRLEFKVRPSKPNA